MAKLPFNLRSRKTFLAAVIFPVIITATWVTFRAVTRHPKEPAREAANAPPHVKALEVLSSQCVNCHSGERQEGGLRLDSLTGVMTGGKSGPAISLKEPKKSLIVQFNHEARGIDLPGGSRTDKLRRVYFTRWIMAGAIWPEAPPTELIGDAWTDARNPVRVKFGGERLNLWSLRRITDPPVPSKKPAEWGRNPIDAFVLRKMQADGQQPAPEADRRTLARRVTFDLTGLPPSPEELDQFLTDPSPEAYSRLVTRLLDSPAYGEHFARAWLDVVRYSDSNGFDYDEFRPQAWRYRDYVIRSLNADKPYDRFVQEQLAGDEMVAEYPETTAEQDCLIATGFLRIGPYDNSAVKFGEEDRCHAQVMSDLVETTGAAFLGMNLSCCRCHDHKVDPLCQTDYYRLWACFEAVAPDDHLLLDLAPQQKVIQEEVTRGQVQLDKANVIKAEAIKRATEAKLEKLPTEDQEFLKEYAKDRKPELKGRYKGLKHLFEPTEAEITATFTPDEKTRFDEAMAVFKTMQGQRLPHTPGFLVTEHNSIPQPTRLLQQGDFMKPKEVVYPGLFSIFDPNPLPPTLPVRHGSSGIRTSLVKWLFSADNPLTARVMVNRLWQQHFGVGLQASSNDFGFAGTQPTHPELLDWLASEFQRQGWSLKKMHRLIVESATYQQALAPESATVQTSLAGRTPRRLTAEALRDTLLSVTGKLQRESGGGPPRWPTLPPETLASSPGLLVENDEKTRGWYPSPPETLNVRSIYLVQKRSLRVPLLENFDQPESNLSCARRIVSTVAPQALMLLNDVFAIEIAQAFAERLQREAGEAPADKIRQAFRLALQRDPAPEEAAECADFLKSRTLPELCRTILNLNEFAYID